MDSKPIKHKIRQVFMKPQSSPVLFRMVQSILLNIKKTLPWRCFTVGIKLFSALTLFVIKLGYRRAGGIRTMNITCSISQSKFVKLDKVFRVCLTGVIIIIF